MLAHVISLMLLGFCRGSAGGLLIRRPEVCLPEQSKPQTAKNSASLSFCQPHVKMPALKPAQNVSFWPPRTCKLLSASLARKGSLPYSPALIITRRSTMAKEKFTGNGKSSAAGRWRKNLYGYCHFVRSERDLEEIVASPYSRQIVQNILDSGHRAALEFDFFLFGVEGYSRVTETQLVRKRLASYLIKSGRAELNGKRSYSVVYPRSVANLPRRLPLPDGHTANLSGHDLAEISRQWYDEGLNAACQRPALPQAPGHGIQGHHWHERPRPARLVCHTLLP